jgi:hypothetical protein
MCGGLKILYKVIRERETMLNTRIGENYNANDVINPNDLRKRIINVDSRFRQNLLDSTTEFSYTLDHPYKNLIRLRVASVEIPNMFYNFTKKNNTFIVKALNILNLTCEAKIEIPPGNYNSCELVDTIQAQLDTKLKNPHGIFINISLDTITAKITFIHNGVSSTPLEENAVPTNSAKNFILDFMTPYTHNANNAHNPEPHKKKLMRKNLGIGYNLGFKEGVYKVTSLSPSPTNPSLNIYSITAEGCLDVVGDTYLFLCVNDLHTVEQRTDETYIQSLAKIIIREDKHMVIYDDGATLMSNEIIFPSPTDLKILNVRLLNPYGEVVDLCGMNFSFSLEITEVQNTRLYDFYRNYIWLGTVPSVNYKSVQGTQQTLLKGAGPPW